MSSKEDILKSILLLENRVDAIYSYSEPNLREIDSIISDIIHRIHPHVPDVGMQLSHIQNDISSYYKKGIRESLKVDFFNETRNIVKRKLAIYRQAILDSQI